MIGPYIGRPARSRSCADVVPREPVVQGPRQARKVPAQLVEDEDNPFSMQRLFQAYQKTGDKQSMERIAQKLARYNEPLIEQAVVVIPFRKSRAASAETGPQRRE